MRYNQLIFGNFFVFILLSYVINQGYSQNAKNLSNKDILVRLNQDPAYLTLKKNIISEFINESPGRWGEFVKGVHENLATREKYVAFTFDACGSEKGNGYDKELIDFLHQENIPATLFISGKWIDRHFDTFLSLSMDTLFEIENHGLHHQPCSMNGKSVYGIRGTANCADAFDEMEANALKIESITKTRPRYYRSGTAYIDEACVRMAGKLGIKVISYQVLSGDAVAFTPDSVIEKNVIKNVKPGAIVIMHFNHPEWNTYEAMRKIVPRLRHLGYKFARLNEFELKSNSE
jgi:peptidoglycan/xylan/chitin deacetylase (PgdA/CDA1 family)